MQNSTKKEINSIGYYNNKNPLLNNILNIEQIQNYYKQIFKMDSIYHICKLLHFYLKEIPIYLILSHFTKLSKRIYERIQTFG